MGKRSSNRNGAKASTIRAANLTPFPPNLPSRGHVCSLFILFITCSPMDGGEQETGSDTNSIFACRGLIPFEEKRTKGSPWRGKEEIERERRRKREEPLMKADRGGDGGPCERITLLHLAPPPPFPRVGVKWSRRLEDLSNNVRSAKKRFATTQRCN